MTAPLVVGDVLTAKQLEQFARTLAAAHRISITKKATPLLSRLSQNQELLRNTYDLIHRVLRDGHSLSPAAEWLLDNFYLIDEQIRTVRMHFPEKYNRELPRLDSGHPRVYQIAKEFVIHTDGRLARDGLEHFVTAYQETNTSCILKLGELWAIPIMLRLALIENLRHIAEHIAAHYIDQLSAKHWADRLVEKSRTSPKEVVIEIADLAKSLPRLSNAFVSEFARGIQAGCSNPMLPLNWIEQQAADLGLSFEDHQHLVSQQHAHNQMSISNSIGSLRFIDSADWRDFVEAVSLVEKCLRQDPAGVYSKMDFLTRDAYRHVIESSARHSRPKGRRSRPASELAVADAVFQRARQPETNGVTSLKNNHVGFYLLGKGRPSLEASLGIKLPPREQCLRLMRAFPLEYYLGCQLLTVILLTWWPLSAIYNSLQPSFEHGNIGSFSILAFLLLGISTSAASSLVNWLTTLLLKPNPWLRLDFSKGVPDDCRTLVAVPSMLGSHETIAQLIDDLEIRYLGNQDRNIGFALITDFVDAPTETVAEDSKLLDTARQGIERLNAKYFTVDCPGPFHLLHRPRLLNKIDSVWMGYERKRGKLGDLNAFLRGGAPGRFISVIGDPLGLEKIRYIITLDADSILTRDSARQLIATIAHPLNKAHIDQKIGVVRDGYAILQPRVTTHRQSLDSSLLMRLTSDPGGIDPYTRAVSDVYQDLFQEGSFIGKGIYDLDAFAASTGDRFPENRILSHDLIEGCFARCGLVTDIQIVEKDPSSYSADARRRHRWMRGDWQIASWLFPIVNRGEGDAIRNPLSGLSRWKVFDNLRRSLIPGMMVALLMIAWSYDQTLARFMTAAVVAYLIIPHCLIALRVGRSRSTSISFTSEILDASEQLARGLAVGILNLIFLPYEAFLALDAAVRSLYRLTFSKKRLLEWCTAADARFSSVRSALGYCQLMGAASVMGISVLVMVLTGLYGSSTELILIAAFWVVSPLLAWAISQPLSSKQKELTADQNKFLRMLSRRTWLFFDTFVTASDHWLPPDNFQEFPSPVVAHRTSPTNIGLSLLSTLGAYDFGYIGVLTMVERIESTLQTLTTLPRYKGHFYNWYDTQTLIPLNPLYISTVDSGNLSGSLFILRRGLLAIATSPEVWSRRILLGIEDTMWVLKDIVTQQKSSQSLRLLLQECDNLQSTLAAHRGQNSLHSSPPDTLVSVLNTFSHKLAAFANEKTFLESNGEPLDAPVARWIGILSAQIADHLRDLNLFMKKEPENTVTKALHARLRTMADQAATLSDQDYDFLYNASNKLLVIGFQVAEGKPDHSYYDLLASEARLASFLGVATGKLPQEHWFALGRQLTTVGGSATLLSWSGSMFEYLMPNLFLPSYKGTLLDQACRLCVKRQIQYGLERRAVWGISESGYNAIDAQFNYQYRAFGVPGLGFKRDLEMDLVVAPYATVMALMVDPQAAIINLKIMSDRGYMGDYGFYESIDFTRNRIPPDVKEILIRSFMAHHQGMSFLSLASLLLDEPMQQRMESDPRFKATELLLQERVPRERPAFSQILIDSELTAAAPPQTATSRIFTNPSQILPDAHLLGNGCFQTTITSAGGGYCKWKDLLLTRWYEDGTKDSFGNFAYIREQATNQVWSIAYQPTLVKGDQYEAIFSEGRAEFRRSDHDLDIHTEIAVSPDVDAEVRHITILNRSIQTREIEITTYGEVVLSSLAADQAHPAFNKLFVETEIIPQLNGILCHRRARVPGEDTPWLGHAFVVHDALSHETSYETDRAAFLGRNHDTLAPKTLKTKLSGTEGAVLDPVIVIRQRFRIAGRATVHLSSILAVAPKKELAMDLIERIQERAFTKRTIALALAHDNMLLRQINSNSTEAMLFGRMVSPLLYGSAPFRAIASLVKSNVRSQSNLWGYGISGDLPIVLLHLTSQEHLSLLRQVVRAHAYWRRKGFAVDLVIWNEDNSGYRQLVHDGILQAIAAAEAASVLDKPGGIFLRRPDQMPDEDRRLMQSVARIVLTDRAGSLEEQIESKLRNTNPFPKLPPHIIKPMDDFEPPVKDLVHSYSRKNFANGLGGFTPDGKEYVLCLGQNQNTPAPWSNIMANPDFGTLVTESGASCTWSENAHEHRLTPWSNDPVADPSGECLFLRDDTNGNLWSPTPAPIPGNDRYTTVHGFGYSEFHTGAFGMATKLVQFVAHDAPVKFFLLTITNRDKKRRSLSATLFLELVLGDHRSKTKDLLVTEFDPADIPQPSMFAKNLYTTDFAWRTAFLTATSPPQSITGDRSEFIGRNRSTRRPAGMVSARLSGRVGALLDPCMAMRVRFDLAPGETKELAFVFGCAKNSLEARSLSKRFGASTARVNLALDSVRMCWSKILKSVVITTPDPAINTLANGWLLYQTLSSRIWGRTSFYQPGGAFGFRDQLQDVMALLYAAPGLARDHILRCARHQFVEGDVQHWWHPPSGKGVRTKFSDDFLWLPYVTSQYIKITGDYEILNEELPFLEQRALEPHEESFYGLPTTTGTSISLYEHCVRALKKSSAVGIHGLPLMGSGDWNDGMNLVGIHGKGESVWLAFFVSDTLRRFVSLAKQRGDAPLHLYCLEQIERLKANIEANAWDGSWYARAFFDDGSPLGVSANAECRIDSLPQSWAVLSGLAPPDRMRMAMESVYQHLVRVDDSLVLVLGPPFDKASPTPGYIAGYLPGVRENGGQYTHAALWTIMAFAEMGDYDRAMELLTLINPVGRGEDAASIQRYKIEPYVVAADVYNNPQHVGRGGWSWYTGAAAWFYRVIIETILGFDLRGDQLRLNPKIPRHWNEFQLDFIYKRSSYSIQMRRCETKDRKQIIFVDDVLLSVQNIHLVDDNQPHRITIECAP